MPIERDNSRECSSRETDYFGCAEPGCHFWQGHTQEFLQAMTQRSEAMCEPDSFKFAFCGGWKDPGLMLDM